MPLESGAQLGHYEVISPIGAGGMGEVYKARDPRLNRTVAIKVLPAHITERAELRERFEREARAIAAFNHPHICVVHDVGRHDEIDFLVMEYLEGETLADRIARGPLPFDQLATYGMQIADALDKAHRHGVTHRDLKPGNIIRFQPGARRIGSFLTRYNGLVMNDLAQETRERARRWLETWKQTGAELEVERVRRLRALTADEARVLARDVLALWRPAEVDSFGAELVMHQRWFAAATRISRTQ